MSRAILLSLASAALLSSCATTGDPTQGGLFGWSENKAEDRIAAREERLRRLDRENDYQRGRSDALESEADRKERQLR